MSGKRYEERSAQTSKLGTFAYQKRTSEQNSIARCISNIDLSTSILHRLCSTDLLHLSTVRQDAPILERESTPTCNRFKLHRREKRSKFV